MVVRIAMVTTTVMNRDDVDGDDDGGAVDVEWIPPHTPRMDHDCHGDESR